MLHIVSLFILEYFKLQKFQLSFGLLLNECFLSKFHHIFISFICNFFQLTVKFVADLIELVSFACEGFDHLLVSVTSLGCLILFFWISWCSYWRQFWLKWRVPQKGQTFEWFAFSLSGRLAFRGSFLKAKSNFSFDTSSRIKRFIEFKDICFLQVLLKRMLDINSWYPDDLLKIVLLVVFWHGNHHKNDLQLNNWSFNLLVR